MRDRAFSYMKHLLSFTAVALAMLMTGCLTQQSGSVNKALFEETMRAERMAVTPSQPGWLLEKPQVHHLSDADLNTLRTMLRKGKVRNIPDAYYHSLESGNRGDTSTSTFYLYGSNMQCLGARIIGDRVLLDDLELDEPTQKELFRLLRPYLVKLYRSLPK